MRPVTNREEILAAASQVAQQAEVPTLAEVALQLAMVEKRRQQLMTMLDYRADEMEQSLDEQDYQLLMDFILLQAAKKNVDSDELLLELQFKFGLQQLRHLPVNKLWAALAFVKAYA